MDKFNYPNTPKQWCTSCMMSRPKEGGMERVHKSGLTKRWICGWCVDRAKQRKKEAA